jgi:hypothetical protein
MPTISRDAPPLTRSSESVVKSPSTIGTIVYSPNCKVGTASLDLSANTPGSVPVVGISYPITIALPNTISVWVHPISNPLTTVPLGFGSSSTTTGFAIALDGNNVYTDCYISGTNYGIPSLRMSCANVLRECLANVAASNISKTTFPFKLPFKLLKNSSNFFCP